MIAIQTNPAIPMPINAPRESGCGLFADAVVESDGAGTLPISIPMSGSGVNSALSASALTMVICSSGVEEGDGNVVADIVITVISSSDGIGGADGAIDSSTALSDSAASAGTTGRTADAGEGEGEGGAVAAAHNPVSVGTVQTGWASSKMHGHTSPHCEWPFNEW